MRCYRNGTVAVVTATERVPAFSGVDVSVQFTTPGRFDSTCAKGKRLYHQFRFLTSRRRELNSGNYAPDLWHPFCCS